MQKFVVLFRGVNVGGKNLLPMKELVAHLKQNNFESVSSYIQSGNVVLKSLDVPSEKIKDLVFQHYDFSPAIFSLDEEAFTASVNNNPYPEFEGKFVHFYFCESNIELALDKLNQYKTDSEEYYVKDNVFYLHAPDGIGRSKLVANIEKCLGQSGTGRNLNTINKISKMLENA